MPVKWNDITLQRRVMKIVSQLSSRFFLGEDIRQNPDWLHFTIDYGLSHNSNKSYACGLNLFIQSSTGLCYVIRRFGRTLTKTIAPVVK